MAKKISPIPEGYQAVTPELSIKGAAEAIEFYKTAFGAEERSRMPGPDGKIMHAEIRIAGCPIMLGEPMMGEPTRASIHLYVPDADAAFQRATKAGAQVVVPMDDAFWGDRYGVVSDRWGNRWGIATHQEELSRDEIVRRGEDFMKKAPQQQHPS